MALRAVRLVPIWKPSTANILAYRNWFQMVGVNALPVPAEMVKHQVIWDRAHEEQPQPAMRPRFLPHVAIRSRKSAVASIAKQPLPFPTNASGVYTHKKAGNVTGFSLEIGAVDNEVDVAAGGVGLGGHGSPIENVCEGF